MKLLLFILFFVPMMMFSQITVIKVTKQRDMFTEKVIREGWPKENPDSWYGNPDTGLDFAGIGYDGFWNQPKGKRTFYTNISENQRIFRGDSVNLISGGGSQYLWNTGDSTRILKVSPLDTTTYSVKIKDDNRETELSVTVFIEDRIFGVPIANLGNDNVICKGESVFLISNGTPTSTYLWNTGEITQGITVTPDVTQTYSVTITDGTNSDTDTVIIIVNNCN